MECLSGRVPASVPLCCGMGQRHAVQCLAAQCSHTVPKGAVGAVLCSAAPRKAMPSRAVQHGAECCVAVSDGQNRQSIAFSERGQLSQAIPQFHVERMFNE